MKLLIRSTDRFCSKWISLPILLLTSSLYLWQIELKAIQAQQIEIANVDHDIDDIINTPKTKYKPTSYERNSRTEAERPRDNRRRQPQPASNNSEANRSAERKRK